MIHIIDGQQDTILDYITLKDINYDNHTKSLENTLETYDATVFGDRRYNQFLEKRNRIIIPDEDGSLIEFILFEVEKYRDRSGLQTRFIAGASYLDLKKANVVYPGRYEGTVSQQAGRVLNNSGWQVGIVESSSTRTFEVENHTNPYEFLKRIARELNLELRFRIEHDGKRITGRFVDLLERVGEWRGREVTFGKDLDGIHRIEKQDVVTALLGLGPEKEDGTRLEVLVEDEDALKRWGRVDKNGNLHHLIEPYEIQSTRIEMTEEEARQYTRSALDKRINTQVTYEADIIDLENVPGMENKKIRFGDTIRIKDEKFNPPLYLEARVFEQQRSIKDKSHKIVKLGDFVEYTEEEVQALFRQMQAEIRRRLERLILVSIVSSAGNVFKNGIGLTELTAKTFLNGNEVDEDGTKYEYRWHKFDKNGDYVPGFYKEGKTITVNASDIDEKATFRVEIILDDEVLTVHEITLTNVFDGEDGEPGPPGPKGDKGDKGDPGPQGPPGTSITSIVEYYLATDQSSGVTRSTPGWTTTIQQMTPQKRYLWNYERINFSDGTHQNTNPVIIGVYGDEGEEGRSIVGITEYYLATNASSGVTRSTSGWTTTMQVTTPEKRYLWNYEEITWNKAPLETYTDPVIIGVHGERGPQGPQGPQGIQGPPGQDGQSQYVHIRYSANSNGNPMTTTPQSDTKYIGLAVTTSPTAPSSYTAYTWSKYRGEDGQDGIPGPPGKDGEPTYTWVKYADDEHGNGMSDSPDGKLYIGLAFNKTTPEESNNPADYTWSLMPQNIEIGGRNLIRNSERYVLTPRNTGQPSDNFNYATIYLVDGVSLINGQKYTGSANVEITHGNFDRITVLSRKEGNTTNARLGDIPIVNGRIEFTFTANGEEALFLFYAGVSGETRGNGVIFTNVQIEKGDKATDWRPAPEDVQEQIDEAKQEAEEAKQEAQNAMSTADGKNTVFRQSNTPPTTNRKIGDLWFKTDEGNKMFVWTGSWTETKLDHQALSVGKLSAISADLGNVTAGDIRGVTLNLANGKVVVDSKGNAVFKGHLEGASGTFGEVTVTDGDFNLQDATTSVKYSATPRRNIIKDHSFELVRENVESMSPETFVYNWLDILPYSTYQDSSWMTYGSPKVTMQFRPDSSDALPIFGKKAVVVRNANYIYQYVYEGVGANSQYTVSAFFKRQWNAQTGGIPRIEIWHVSGLRTRYSRLVNATFTPVKNDYTVERHAVTITTPSNFNEEDGLEIIISGGNDRWIQCDGVQMVEGDRPSVYQPEDSIWEITSGLYRPIKHTPRQVLWTGALFPLSTHTIRPSKTIYECITGWVLEWSRYVPGQGEFDLQFSYTHIPKISVQRNHGVSRSFIIPRDFTQIYWKYLFVYHDRIVGHDNNNNANGNGVVLRAVYEY